MKIATAVARSQQQLPQHKVQITNAFATLYHHFNGQLDWRVCGHLLQLCINHSLDRQGKQIHAHIVLNSVAPENFLASKLILFYSKIGLPVQARKVFDQIPHKNIFSWNAMFIAYSVHEKHNEILKLFSSLVKVSSSTIDHNPPPKPDNLTITCVLKALSTLFPYYSKIVKVIHGFVLQNGYFCDSFLVNALVTFYARSGDFGFARKLFDTTSKKNIVIWNSMIVAYSQSGFYEECLDLFREMVGSVGLIPNGVTMVSVLQACTHSNNLAFGSEVHRYIIENNIKVDAAVCNTIIRLYAKCGNLDYARELFDEMDNRDYVSYGSLISGYMNHGFAEKAMELFRELQVPELSTWNAVLSGLVQNNLHDSIPELIREMQAKGCRPNPVTLSSVLPTFSHFSQLKAGKQIHCYAIRNNYDGNIYVASALIDLYGKTGSLLAARWLFQERRDKCVIIWTSIISAYADHGIAGAALTLFTDMLTCGVKPDPVTFTAVLAACAHAGLVDKAYKIFEAMFPVYGIFPSLEHYACMVRVLSRAGRLYEAKSFILKMPIEPCAKVWGGALDSGVSAFATLYHQFNGLLNCRLCGFLLQRCTNNGLVRQGKQIHAHIVLNSVTPENFLASKLIYFYSKIGHFFQARKVFDRIPHKNLFSWNVMFMAYSSNEQHNETLKLFSLLMKVSSSTIDLNPRPKPDSYSITCVLMALSTLFPYYSKIVKGIHGFVLRHGYFCDNFVVNAFMTFYARSGDFGFARRLFDMTSERDIVIWSSMIAEYSQGGFYEECLDLFREMVGSVGLIPNGVAMMSVLQACTHSNNLAFGSEVHRFIIENNIKVDAAVYNTIIRLYAKCGNLDYARELFDEMDNRDFVSYGSMISGYMNHGFVENAMELFRELQVPELSTWNAVLSGLVQNNLHDDIPELICEMQAKGCRPNAVTLSSVLPTFSHFSQLKAGKQIHCYVIRNNYDKNIYVVSALIGIYGKTGSLQAAHWLFKECRDKCRIIWTSIISAYATNGDADASLTLFTDMLTCGVKPDPVTFTAVLAACAHAGLVDKAYKIFEAMFPVYGIFPSLEHYACMVGVLSRAGRLYEAKSFILKMPVEPCAKVWGALLSGVPASGDVELGKFVCDRLFELEPGKYGNYIFLANLYSQAGRWDEAERVREKMKNMGVKRSSGCSWIETSGGLRSFTAGDFSRNKKDISEMLELLVQMMGEEGYVATIELDEENLFCTEST